MKLNKAIIFVAFLFAPFLVASQDVKQALANQYVDLRGATWELQQASKPAVTDAQRQQFVQNLFDGIVEGNPKSRRWVADHPARNSLREALESDLAKLVDLGLRTQGSAGSVNLKNVFVEALATMFSEIELRELLAYYSGPQGSLFVSTQKIIHDKVQTSLRARQANFSSTVEYPRRTNPDPEKFAELLGLFDEVVRIQMAMLDPGPNGDRTGLQAIGFMTSAGVVDMFPEIWADWEQVPEADRLEILSRRKSVQGLREREVIYKAAGKIRTVYKPEQGMDEMMRATVALEVKAGYLIERLALRFP